MTVFNAYARYYDLLYSDKQYQREANYIHKLLKQNDGRNNLSLLELGCGTGKHAICLAKKGYIVHGIDKSDVMLNEAERRRKSVNIQIARSLAFSVDDARLLNLKMKFDAVVSLFHVISYQTTNHDLRSVFSNVRRHLKHHGLFIFDCWYGPAVLQNTPEVRIKRIEDRQLKIIRIAEPTMYPNENCVDVKYHMMVQNRQANEFHEISECHRVRYLFLPEIRAMYADHDMEFLFCYEWLTEKEPGSGSWSVCCGGRAR